jgi:hypothetical protein
MKELFVFICLSYFSTCLSQKEINQNSLPISEITRLSINVQEAHDSMIVKETILDLQKNRELKIIQADQSMILLDTPDYLKKYHYLTVVSANKSIILIETPVFLKKE